MMCLNNLKPALLYLVPCCLIPVLIRAKNSNHFEILWNGPIGMDMIDNVK